VKAFFQKYTNYFTFLILLVFLILIKIINPAFVKSISYLSFDLYQKVFAEKKDSDVVIIDIDENSLGKFGQFPWNRKVFADILDKINESNPKAIGFDIFFTEKDKQSPDEIIKRHPFPGPGLAIRILGEVNNEKLDCLRDADWIVRDEIIKAGLYNDIWQAFAVLLPVKTVGVMGDKRT